MCTATQKLPVCGGRYLFSWLTCLPGLLSRRSWTCRTWPTGFCERLRTVELDLAKSCRGVCEPRKVCYNRSATFKYLTQFAQVQSCQVDLILQGKWHCRGSPIAESLNFHPFQLEACCSTSFISGRNKNRTCINYKRVSFCVQFSYTSATCPMEIDGKIIANGKSRRMKTLGHSFNVFRGCVVSLRGKECGMWVSQVVDFRPSHGGHR